MKVGGKLCKRAEKCGGGKPNAGENWKSGGDKLSQLTSKKCHLASNKPLYLLI
jgi:hypothetical protein